MKPRGLLTARAISAGPAPILACLCPATANNLGLAVLADGRRIVTYQVEDRTYAVHLQITHRVEFAAAARRKS